MPRVIVRPRRGQGGNLYRGLAKLLRESADTRPGFSDTWAVERPRPEEEVIERYEVDGNAVTITSNGMADGARYHITPWEYGLDPETMGTLRRTMEELARSPPGELSMDVTRMRTHMERGAASLLSTSLGISPSDAEGRERLTRLSRVVGRYTIGMGVIENLLNDQRIEDIYLDSPVEDNPIHVTLNGVAGTNSIVHCTTNLVASEHEMEALISRLRGSSSRPFSEAFPVLETDVNGFDARATVIGPPLSPMGRALAIRKHSSTPWTLQRMVANHTLDPMAAGLLSFLVDGRSTILICGSRGAGKSSLLSAAMFEFPSTQRILTIEDTRELPVRQMQRLGYKVQSLLVDRGVEEGVEDKTDEALRVSLRLGESAIVLGEVRGGEARTLYQSMRTGKAGSSVLGTIHGESSRSVYERVVHDMSIPPEAFMATDVVLTMGLVRPRGSQRQMRRLVEVSECGASPGEFDPLLLHEDGETRVSYRSRLIAKVATSWGMEVEEAVRNIELRGKMRAYLVSRSEEHPELLGPKWALCANQFLWRSMEEPRGTDEVLSSFEEWCGRRLGEDA